MFLIEFLHVLKKSNYTENNQIITVPKTSKHDYIQGLKVLQAIGIHNLSKI